MTESVLTGGVLSRCIHIAGTEIRRHFLSPSVYLLLVVFQVVPAVWLFYIQGFLVRGNANLGPYFAIMPVFLAMWLPVLTMNLRRPLPLAEAETVVGTYLGVLTVFATGFILSLSIPVSIAPLGDFDTGHVLGGYIGLFLLGMSAAAIGELASVLAHNQLAAYLTGAGILLTLTYTGYTSTFVDLPHQLHSLARYISIDAHLSAPGVIDTRDLVYFLLLTLGALSLSVRVLRWRNRR